MFSFSRSPLHWLIRGLWYSWTQSTENILLNRLSSIGQHEITCNWFQNYLTNRTQAIVADEVTLPVGQWRSTPGNYSWTSILCALYVNDIAMELENCKVHMYSMLMIQYYIPQCPLTDKPLHSAFNSIQHALASLKLVLNASKTS